MKYLLMLFMVQFSQSNAQEVRATSGGHFTNDSTQMSFTIGEPLTLSYLSSTPKVTQGFHQVKITTNGNSIATANNTGISLYPNPAKQSITLESKFPTNHLEVKIYNTLGQLISSQKIITQKTELNITHLPIGNYIFEILNTQNQSIFKHNITIE